MLYSTLCARSLRSLFLTLFYFFFFLLVGCSWRSLCRFLLPQWFLHSAFSRSLYDFTRLYWFKNCLFLVEIGKSRWSNNKKTAKFVVKSYAGVVCARCSHKIVVASLKRMTVLKVVWYKIVHCLLFLSVLKKPNLSIWINAVLSCRILSEFACLSQLWVYLFRCCASPDDRKPIVNSKHAQCTLVKIHAHCVRPCNGAIEFFFVVQYNRNEVWLFVGNSTKKRKYTTFVFTSFVFCSLRDQIAQNDKSQNYIMLTFDFGAIFPAVLLLLLLYLFRCSSNSLTVAVIKNKHRQWMP